MADPPSLLALPVEIQLAICDQLARCHQHTTPAPLASSACILENLPALGNLALTCKHFQQLTIPLLYQHVKVSIFKPAAFFRLIKHFSRFPDHAAHVKALTIASSRDDSTLSRTQVEFLRQQAKRLGVEPAHMHRGIGLPIRPESVLIDVVLCQVPAIRKLVLSIPRVIAAVDETSSNIFDDDADDDEENEDVLWYAVRLPDHLVLGSLRYLEAHPPSSQSDPAAKLHKASLAALLRHAPALTQLRVGRYAQVSPGIIQNPLPQLRDIRLLNALVTDVAAIARFCPRLERFRLGTEYCTLHPSTDFWTIVTLEMLAASHPNATACRCELLLPLKLTLRHLDLGYDLNYAPQISILTCCAALKP